MNEDFGFELPDASVELTHKEYVNLVNRIRGNFLSYVSVLDSTLSAIITGFFLRDEGDFALWARTVFDEDRAASFGAKIIWTSRIVAGHPGYAGIGGEDRTRLQQKLDGIRRIRNDFAHNVAWNKEAEPGCVRGRLIKLYDFEEGRTVPRYFAMHEIMDIINDGWVLEQLGRIEEATLAIRDGAGAGGGDD